MRSSLIDRIRNDQIHKMAGTSDGRWYPTLTYRMILLPVCQDYFSQELVENEKKIKETETL